MKGVVILILGLTCYLLGQDADSVVTVIKLYQKGEYSSFKDAAFKLLSKKPISRLSEIKLRMYLGFSEVALGEFEAAKAHFQKSLALHSNLKLEPGMVSPKIEKIFKYCQEALPTVQLPLELRFKKEILPLDPHFSLTKYYFLKKNYFPLVALSGLFPGSAQLLERRFKKGLFFAITAAGGLFLAIQSAQKKRETLEAYRKIKKWADPALEKSYQQAVKYHILNRATICGLSLLWLWNLWDVWWNIRKDNLKIEEYQNLVKTHRVIEK
jgi:hypothetical protein